MSENLRESFRIGPEGELEAELAVGARSAPCDVVNLSAGGAKVVGALRPDSGTTCTLRVRIRSDQRGAGAPPWIDFDMECLESVVADADRFVCRLRNVTAPGSPDYERAAKLVFEAQRRARGRASGTADASPMITDAERRSALRIQERARFSRGSLRPDQGD